MLWYMLYKKLVIGRKKIKFENFCGNPIALIIGSLKKNNTTKAIKLKKRLIKKVKAKTLAASILFLGNTMVTSYLRAETMVTMLNKLKKTAIAPKSSGVYILLKKG